MNILIKTFIIIFFSINLFAEQCEFNFPQVTKNINFTANDFTNNRKNGTLIINNKIYHFSDTVKLKRGVNKLILNINNCNNEYYIVFSPKMFFRPYITQNSIEEIEFSRIVNNPIGITNLVDPHTISNSIRETDPVFDAEIKLGQVFYAQILDHDLTSNAQFQSGPSVNPNRPQNLQSPFLDLDNIYGYGRDTEDTIYKKDGLRFVLTNNGQDVPRTKDNIALIPDKRDDISGLTIQTHILFMKYHNFLIKKYLNRVSHKKLNKLQKTWLFEMVRNLVIGAHQGIAINELGPLLTGKKMDLNQSPLKNIPVEFSAATYRIGHTLVPNEVVIDEQGTKISPLANGVTKTDPLRGPNRNNISWKLLLGKNAQPSGRFDDRIAPVMQELIIPISPTNHDQFKLAGGEGENIGQGRQVSGTTRLDLVETNILRAREQNLPSGEEILAFINQQEYNPANGNTDLFLFILQEATSNNFKYGKVGTFVFERTIGGMLKADRYAITKRFYTRKDKRFFRRIRLEKIVKISYPKDFR